MDVRTFPKNVLVSEYQFINFSLLLASLGIITYVFYQRVLSPLATIPGPFSASLSRLWITHLSWKGGSHTVMVNLHKELGSLVRTAPNEVSIADVDAIKKIYAPGTKFRKSDWYSVWQGRRKFDLFPERNEKIHATQRRLVSHPYSMESLKGLEKYVDDCVQVFCKNMDRLLGQDIDLGQWIQLFAFDVIGEMTFSKRFGFMENGQDDGTFKQIENALHSASWIGQVPWLYWLNDYLSPILGNHVAIAARHGSLRNFAIEEVNNRKDRGSDHQDILSKLFKISEEKPKDFDMTSVMSMASSNIFAGSDTTAISTRSIIYHLLKHPQYRKKLLAELDEARHNGKLSSPATMDEARELPYLQACMYEALRCHPPVGMSLPRVVPEGGFEVNGHFLPAGTVIGANPWVVHQSKEVFGEDADQFRPDRWLQEDNGDMREIAHRLLRGTERTDVSVDRCFFTFGAGARMCLGKNIGWMEMSKLIPTLFLKYDMQLTDPDATWTTTSWWFVIQRGLNVTFRPRDGF